MNRALLVLLASAISAAIFAPDARAGLPEPTLAPLHATADLNLGESAEVEHVLMRQGGHLARDEAQVLLGVLDRIITDQRHAIDRNADHGLLELHLDQPAFGTEFDDVTLYFHRHPGNEFRALEHQIDQLIYRSHQLEQENKSLRQQEVGWKKERAKLIDKNELARTRVEAMIHRLKALEQEYGTGAGLSEA